ncbi:ABC transporter permease [Acutalibacter caecimuris]|uniref:ABC transporter permease n=1 Tax=Acutalibacter caecimuris TaxID=3093657 RepID=UPI002AC90244|nr:ABC transporter permease subunit [Acutalibacter sp. M00118]
MNMTNAKTVAPQWTRLWVKFKKGFKANIWYYLLMLPGLLALLVFRYVPMGGLVIAFKDFKVAEGMFGSAWVGTKWFDMLFSNREFGQVLFNTIYISLLKLIFSFPAPILLALMINEVSSVGLKRSIQTVVYLPHFISWVVIGGVLTTILSPSVGILSYFGLAKNPLLEPGNFRWMVVVSDIWKEAGWGTVVYLAAITNISPELYEAATVDGANRFQKILHITLPAIASTIAVMLILRTGSLLSAGFDQMYVLQTPATMDVGDVLDTFVYRYGLAQGRFSYAAAAGLFQSVVGLILVSFSNFVTGRMGQDGIW